MIHSGLVECWRLRVWSSVGDYVPNSEEGELRCILAYLREGRAGTGDAAADEDAMTAAWLTERSMRRDDEDVEMLRALGYNRREREALRRRRNTQRPNKRDRDREIAVKRIAYYLNENVKWNETTSDPNVVCRAWAGLSDYNVERCNDWWRRGVDPLDYAKVLVLVEHGLSPTDLLTDVKGKTILQHLKEGTSMQWCVLALDFERKRPSTVSRRTGSGTGTGWSA
jgi:hypothetical protein